MDRALTREQIATTVIILISEQSGEPATMESSLIDDLGLDSLDFVNIAQVLEEEFRIGPIPDNDLFKLQTVEQVVLYVESWLRNKEKAELAAGGQTA